MIATYISKVILQDKLFYFGYTIMRQVLFWLEIVK
jgi:hypothetical protein